MTEGRSTLARCEAHGLAYDPSLHDGCVICRRGMQSSAPPRVEPGQGVSRPTRSIKLGGQVSGEPRRMRLATVSACASIIASSMGSRPVRRLHSGACVKIRDVAPISV